MKQFRTSWFGLYFVFVFHHQRSGTEQLIMATNVDIASIIHLPVADRLRLIEDIWDSVIREPEKVPVPEWHREELQRRLKTYESNPKEGAPWPEVRQRIKESKQSKS